MNAVDVDKKYPAKVSFLHFSTLFFAYKNERWKKRIAVMPHAHASCASLIITVIVHLSTEIPTSRKYKFECEIQII